MSDERRAAFAETNRGLQETLRFQHSQRKEKPLLPYETARANRLAIDWAAETLPVPPFIGRRVVNVPLEDLVPYIDWTFFFAAWELKGRYPAILEHPDTGGRRATSTTARRSCSIGSSARNCSPRPASTGSGRPSSEDDDIVVYADREHAGELTRFNLLRQQEVIADGKPNLSLADFIAPRSMLGAGRSDYLGAFAVTAGIGADELAKKFEGEHDDYSAILVKALADRLAEAFAAYLHQQARAAWGIDEARGVDDVHHETHRGIRPAFGYPACPDHSEKFKLFDLLDATEVGIALTENAAMTPAASVSGLYFAHPQARYFTVGRLGEDQIAVYARRKGQSIDQVERWLTSNLAYEPARC